MLRHAMRNILPWGYSVLSYLFGRWREAQGKRVGSCRRHVLGQARVATATTVSDASLPEVEVGEDLRGTHQIVGVLAAIEHVVVELCVVEMRQREGHHALGGNLQLGAVVAERELEDGVETLEVNLPCLFTMEKINYPVRIPNLKGKLAAKKAVITTITADDIPGLDRGRIGDPGSPTKVPRMFPPVMPEPGMIIDEGSVEASVKKLMQLIKG